MPSDLFFSSGASGYGIRPDGSYGPITTPNTRQAAPPGRPDYAVINPQGVAVSILTGKPWSGVDPRTGQHFTNGQTSAASAGGVQVPFSNQTINPNDPSQRYRPVDIVKSPDIAQAQSDLMDTFRKTADASLKGFSEYLNNFKTDLTGARSAAARATDTTGTEAALRGAVDQYGNALDSSNAAYQRALAESAAAQRGVVGQANAALPSYDAAVESIKQQQIGDVLQQFSKYKLGSSTPASASGYDTAALAGAIGRVAAPMELAKINQRYNILSGMALPVEQGIGREALTYAGSYLPGIAGSRYGAETGTTQAIQALRNQVAGMSYDNALRFMQSAGVPAAVIQQVLAGQISQVGGLANLEELSRYRGLQDVLGAYPSQPTGFDMSLPGYPSYPTRYPTRNTLAPNAPITINPTLTGGGGGGTVTTTGSPDEMALRLYDLYGLTPEDYASLQAPVRPRYSPNIGSQTPASLGGTLSPDDYQQMLYQQYGGV